MYCSFGKYIWYILKKFRYNVFSTLYLLFNTIYMNHVYCLSFYLHYMIFKGRVLAFLMEALEFFLVSNNSPSTLSIYLFLFYLSIYLSTYYFLRWSSGLPYGSFRVPSSLSYPLFNTIYLPISFLSIYLSIYLLFFKVEFWPS